MGKTIRFGDLVRASGRPHLVTLWVDPKKDPSFSKAIRENRVLTIHTDPTNHKKEYGEIGFHQEHGNVYLVFPESLPKEEARIVGINYQLAEEQAPIDWITPQPHAPSKPVPKEKAQVKQPKPEPKLQLKTFEVIVRRTATQEQSVSVKAENEAAARAVSMEMVKKKRFDVGLTTMQVEVASLIEKTKA